MYQVIKATDKRLLSWYSDNSMLRRGVSPISGSTASNETPISVSEPPTSFFRKQRPRIQRNNIVRSLYTVQRPIKNTSNKLFILWYVFLRRQSPPLSCWTGAWQMSWQSDPGSFRQLNHHSSQPPQTRLCTRPFALVIYDC